MLNSLKSLLIDLKYIFFRFRILYMGIQDEISAAESDNEKVASEVIKAFLFVSLLLPVFLGFGVLIGAFEISGMFLLRVTGSVYILAIPPLIIIKKSKNKVFTKYYGIISCSLLVGVVGGTGHIGLYILYGIFPLLSAVYMDKKFTYKITLICYVIMIASMAVRVNRSYAVRLYTGEPLTKIQYFFTYVTGFTFEYILVFITARSMVKRSEKQMKRIYQLLHERENFLQEKEKLLQDVTKKNIDYALKIDELNDTQLKIIGFLGQILGSHDMFTGNHVLHTQVYISIIAKELVKNGHYTEELTPKFISQLETSALLHDIGKIHIPDGILNMNGKFTEEEYAFMKSHPQEGKKLLEFLPQIDGGYLNKIAIDMTYCHHEKWDGSGYPRGISQYEIPLCARIMAAADVFDALVSRRIYKEPVSIDEAIKIFENSRGTHFEPVIVDAVISCRDELEAADTYFKIQENHQNQIEMEWWARYREYNKKRANKE